MHASWTASSASAAESQRRMAKASIRSRCGRTTASKRARRSADGSRFVASMQDEDRGDGEYRARGQYSAWLVGGRHEVEASQEGRPCQGGDYSRPAGSADERSRGGDVVRALLHVPSTAKLQGCPSLRQFSSGSFLWQFPQRRSVAAWSSCSRAS